MEPSPWLATFDMVKHEAAEDLCDFERWNELGVCTYTLVAGAQWCLFL